MKNRPMGKRNKAFLVWVAVFVALGLVVYFTRGSRAETHVGPVINSAKKEGR